MSLSIHISHRHSIYSPTKCIYQLVVLCWINKTSPFMFTSSIHCFADLNRNNHYAAQFTSEARQSVSRARPPPLHRPATLFHISNCQWMCILSMWCLPSDDGTPSFSALIAISGAIYMQHALACFSICFTSKLSASSIMPVSMAALA